jgi:hypothetical protein
MKKYNLLKDTDPETWLEMDESECINLIEEYHKRAKIKMPNHTVHATIHAVVESHIAMGDDLPVKAALQRLMSEGLDRHEAIHAIGSFVSEQMFLLMNDKEAALSTEDFLNRIRNLTREEWEKICNEEEEDF